MDVFQAIQERREITKYANEPIPEDVLTKIEDAGVLHLQVITCHQKV